MNNDSEKNNKYSKLVSPIVAVACFIAAAYFGVFNEEKSEYSFIFLALGGILVVQTVAALIKTFLLVKVDTSTPAGKKQRDKRNKKYMQAIEYGKIQLETFCITEGEDAEAVFYEKLKAKNCTKVELEHGDLYYYISTHDENNENDFEPKEVINEYYAFYVVKTDKMPLDIDVEIEQIAVYSNEVDKILINKLDGNERYLLCPIVFLGNRLNTEQQNFYLMFDGRFTNYYLDNGYCESAYNYIAIDKNNGALYLSQCNKYFKGITVEDAVIEALQPQIK